MMIASILYSGLTLYMMALLLRWLGPWLELEFRGLLLGRIPAITDPCIQFMRRMLPPMGPLDFAPLAAVMGVFIVRLVLVGV
ncbi:MAG: YggT family protein [Candidatus Hydrogenedentes bacterium]|nr:YggT family protein [Candidatus Hydrogenedentota bacterium]